MSRRRRLTAVIASVISAGLVAVSPLSAAVAAPAPAPGTLTTFAGGLGGGPAADVAQTPFAIAARNGRLISVDGTYDLPYSGPWPGLVREIDLATGIEKVLAGMLPGGYRGDGGPATSAQLNRPGDAAIDAAGNVYITDTENHRVRKVTAAGIISTFAGNGVAGFTGEGAAASSASINRPGGIAVSPAGDVVFADRGNYRVRQVSPSGRITTLAGNGARSGPAGDGSPATAVALDAQNLEFDSAGNLYVADFLHSSLRKIGADGTISTVAAPADFWGGLTADGSGNLYLSASPGVVRLDPSGAITPIAGTTRPLAPGEGNGDGGPALDAHLSGGNLAFDGGNLYITEPRDNRIRRVDADGIITTFAGNGLTDYGGDGGRGVDAQFRATSRIRSGPTGTYIGDAGTGDVRRVDPSGIVTTVWTGGYRDFAVDDGGNLFLSSDNRVRRLTPSGVLSTVAGVGGAAGFTGDGGPAILARLSSPTALAVGAGNLYLYDYGNRRIRRVDPLGVISTHVGGSTDPYGYITYAGDTYMNQIWEMAVGPNGSLFWTEWGGQFGPSLYLRKVACGIVSSVASSQEGTSTSLAVDASGSAYFLAGHLVFRAKADGTVTAVAGSGGSVPLEGVPATSVALRYPNGVAIHPSGQLLFGNEKRVYQVTGITAGRVAAAPPCPPADRPVWGVGYNALGQLGDGTTVDRDLAASGNPPLTGVTAASGGVGHSLALRSDGTVWAWGWNGYGQLGDGTTSPRLRPVPVPGLTGVVAVAGGAFHSLALKADGTVWAWGWNPFGQLGDGTLAQRTSPVRVPGLTGVTAVSGGTLHSLAVKADGSVWAWGWNGVGQLGDGTVVDHRLPARVPGVAGATGVAAGGLHSLAVTSDGSVWAWGWNMFGQLGDGTTAERHVAGQVWGLTDATAVATGSYHSLALRRDGTVAAWGFGNVGQIGNSSGNSSLVPFNSYGATGVVAVAAGAFHSVGLQADGNVLVWGWNHFGQLGVPAPSGWETAATSGGLAHVTAIGTGAYHTLFAHRVPA